MTETNESTPETAFSEKNLHDLVTGNITTAMQYHIRDTARFAAKAVLMRELTGGYSEAEAMKVITRMAQTLSIVQDLIPILESHVGLTSERKEEVSEMFSAFPTEKLDEALQSVPAFKKSMEDTVEAQMASSAEKLKKVMKERGIDPNDLYKGFNL